MRLCRSAGWRTWTILGVAALATVLPSGLPAQTGQGTARISPIPPSVLDLQRTYDNARARREPVTHLLADDFVEIQADGRVLARAQAIEKNERFDDVSSGSLSERRRAAYGDVVLIAGRTGEEGTPYSARRLYVWVNNGSWRLLVFQKTFIRSRAAKLSPLRAAWPATDRSGPAFVEEETFATGDPALLRGLLAEDSVLVDGYGEQLTGLTWFARLNETKGPTSNVRSLSVLHQGEATVVIGDEVSTVTGLAARFTRIWTRSGQGRQLRFSQTSLAAGEVFGPER
jgi:hypothetical protein